MLTLLSSYWSHKRGTFCLVFFDHDAGITIDTPDPQKAVKTLNLGVPQGEVIKKMIQTGAREGDVYPFVMGVEKYNPLERKITGGTEFYTRDPRDRWRNVVKGRYRRKNDNHRRFLYTSSDAPQVDRLIRDSGFIPDRGWAYGMTFEKRFEEVEVLEQEGCSCGSRDAWYFYAVDGGEYVLRARACHKCGVVDKAYHPSASALLGEKWETTDLADDRRVPMEYPYRRETKKKITFVPLESEESKRFVDRYADRIRPNDEVFGEFADRVVGLSSPSPDMQYWGLDIEVQMLEDRTIVPTPYDQHEGGVLIYEGASQPIICVSLAHSDGTRVTFMNVDAVSNEDGPFGQSLTEEDYGDVRYYENESDMLNEFFMFLRENPGIYVTYNGDGYDLPYLKIRGEGLPNVFGSPIVEEWSHKKDKFNIRGSIHIDLLKWARIRPVKLYVYNKSYDRANLDTFAYAVTGERKTSHDIYSNSGHKKHMWEYGVKEFAYYCINDAHLLVKVMRARNRITEKAMIMLMRLCNIKVENAYRRKSVHWSEQMMARAHIWANYWIPSKSDIQELSPPGKKRGGEFGETVSGVFFDVTPMDFASEYPNIMRIKNISYETVNHCPDPDCTAHTDVPEENGIYICDAVPGIMGAMVGVITGCRLRIFKPMSKQRDIPEGERLFYVAMQMAYKVLINIQYGVSGNASYAFYHSGVLRATTAYARYALFQCIIHAEEIGVPVVTWVADSVFLLEPTQEQIDEMSRFSEEELFGLELDAESTFKVLILQDRKNNYVGYYEDYADGSPHPPKISGTGISKSNFNALGKAFLADLVDKSAQHIRDNPPPDDTAGRIEWTKRFVQMRAQTYYDFFFKLAMTKTGEEFYEGEVFDLDDFIMYTRLGKGIDEYAGGRRLPEHAEVAKRFNLALEATRAGRTPEFDPQAWTPEENYLPSKYRRGSVVPYIKTTTDGASHPCEVAGKFSIIDIHKYHQLVENEVAHFLDSTTKIKVRDDMDVNTVEIYPEFGAVEVEIRDPLDRSRVTRRGIGSAIVSELQLVDGQTVLV